MVELVKPDFIVGKEERFFDFIKNLNADRPFILAGHSQGANILLFLLLRC